MTRKRFIKLLMADGYSRNEANRIAMGVRNRGMEYSAAYTISTIDIDKFCDVVRAIVDTAMKCALAITKAADAFVKTYMDEMEASAEDGR